MCSKQIKWIFYSSALFLLSACGEGLNINTKQSNQASSPACPTAATTLKLTKIQPQSVRSNSGLLKKNTAYFISNKIHISKEKINNLKGLVKLNVQINTQCSQFKKAVTISKQIITNSSTKIINRLSQQYYAYTVTKSAFLNFTKQIQADDCITRVYLNQYLTHQPLVGRQPKTQVTTQHNKHKAYTSQKTLAPTALSADNFTDPFLFRQSHLWAINTFKAFAKIYHQNYGLKTSDTKSIVAVVDTSIDKNHEDLQGVFLNLGNDLVTTTNKDHGTHVASLIAAQANSIGTLGVASKSVKLISYGVVNNSGQISLANLSNALGSVNSLGLNNRPQIVNLSLEFIVEPESIAVPGCPNPNTRECTQIEYSCIKSRHTPVNTEIKNLLDKGVSVVISAGNGLVNQNGLNIGKKFINNSYIKYPSCLSKETGYEDLIVVGSVDVDSNAGINQKSRFSDYGSEYVHIAAPGNASLGLGLYSAVNNNRYDWKAGTSQSAPLVSAAMALAYAVLNKKRDIATIPSAPNTPPVLESVFDKCGIKATAKMRVVKNLMLQSASKKSAMSAYWQKGNILNLENLIQHIELIYPDTKK